MARALFPEERYYRVRATNVLEGFNMLHTYYGPYATKGAAEAQLKRQLRMNQNISPTLSGIEETNAIEWKDAE